MKIDSYNKILKFSKKNEVQVTSKIELPKKLYKYSTISKNSLENLVDRKVHFSHPYNLNDIMDGNFQLLNLEDSYKKYIARTQDKNVSIHSFRQELYKKSSEYFKHIGVYCLTNSYSNNLFWPHYTFEQGFSIEYNTKEFLNSFNKDEIRVIPITYEKLKSINLDEYSKEEKIFRNGKLSITTNINLGLYYTLSYKDEIWKYENEWRLILKRENLGELSHPLNNISDENYNKELESLKNRNIPINAHSIEKIILSNLFFHKKRFREQLRINEQEHFYFRKRNEREIKEFELLFSFFQEMKKNYNNQLFQIDRHFLPEKNEFITKITYQIKIIDLNSDRIIIERRYCS